LTTAAAVAVVAQRGGFGGGGGDLPLSAWSFILLVIYQLFKNV
jgi:hypothetical protein